ncbi:unnamed protein product [Linum tenue]|uniref:Bet v I/Major latex protein domain-containing protein n=1 Tax=Linum tenue TaxID=586396 RepID=A0AAV0GTZ5_9ROSI|nr:unnamed protein product [Linum tenue]
MVIIIMIKEEAAQLKVGVAVDVLWKALAHDLNRVIPHIQSDIVSAADVLEGDGGPGTVYLFTSTNSGKVKEKVAEVDACSHRIGLEVTEGGPLENGYGYHKTTFQLTSAGEEETVVDLTVAYEPRRHHAAAPPPKTTANVLDFITLLEKFLADGAETGKIDS